jgi:hypothetical protein
MSPFGFGKSEEEKQAEAEREARERAAIEAIEAGGIPPEAQRRLAQLREAPGHAYTSTLSVNGAARARELGLRPITQVMGSSVYHVGFQRLSSFGGWAKGSSKHLDVLSHAYARSRGSSRRRGSRAPTR